MTADFESCVAENSYQCDDSDDDGSDDELEDTVTVTVAQDEPRTAAEEAAHHGVRTSVVIMARELRAKATSALLAEWQGSHLL